MPLQACSTSVRSARAKLAVPASCWLFFTVDGLGAGRASVNPSSRKAAPAKACGQSPYARRPGWHPRGQGMGQNLMLVVELLHRARPLPGM